MQENLYQGMKIMRYELADNILTAKDFLKLRESAGWSGATTEEQLEEGINNSLFTVAAIYDNQVIGMGRVVGDRFYICYIQDLIVLPEFQGKGIGKAIMEKLIAYIQDGILPDTDIMVGLFSAKGKEEFYEKFGFSTRADNNRGAGMEMVIESKK